MKRGFTLVELLAVIVILAIISLIAVPIVINIINDSKYESQKRSIDLYAEALKQSVADYQLKNNKKVEGKFNTTDGKTLTREDITLNVDYKGNVVCNRIVVNKDGSIYLSECTVDNDKVYISKSESNKENPKYYEYGKTEYGMIMENKSHSSKFLNTGIYGGNIYQFTISNTLEIEDKETYESADCSYNKDSSVICYWKKLEEKPGYYNMILASDGDAYTPYDSSYLFYNLCWQSNKYLELDFTGLNTSKTTNMSHMFDTVAFYLIRLDLGNSFDTSNVIDMSYMFHRAFPLFRGMFTFPDCFNTKNVTNMSHMFDWAFESSSNVNLGKNFDTSNVTDMSYMFAGMGDNYNRRLDLGDKFDTSNVTNMSHMFDGLGPSVSDRYMIELNLGDNFNTAKVTNMSYMFYDIQLSSELDLGKKFNTSNVTDMSYMFSATFNELNLGSKFDTKKVTNMSGMFSQQSKLKTLDLGDKFDTSNVTSMNNMFWVFGQDMENFSLGDKFDTSNVTSMGGMFNGAFKNKLKKLDLGYKFDTSKVTNMDSMFKETGRESMEELILGSNFDTKNVSDMDNMFYQTGYKKLKKLDLGKKFVTNTTTQWYNLEYNQMFYETGKESMKELDLWNFSGYTRAASYRRNNMFKDCGTEGVLTKVVVSTDSFKNTLINDSNVPQFWKDNNIIQVQAP